MEVNMFGYPVRHRYVDMDNRPISRTPQTNPYNYDEFVQWKKNKEMRKSDVENKSVVYSDRLWQWDSGKYDKCCQEVFGDTGQYFSRRKPEDIERFLSLYFGDEIELLAILEGCNQGNGYPYWIFFYDKKEGK